jgi:uncharacterized protein YvpB
MKKLTVPFYAQHEIIENGKGSVSCGIVCIKMVLDFAGKDKTEIHDLIEEAEIVGNKESAGWSHETLVRVLRNHGVLAFRQEFKSHTVSLEDKKGFENIEETKNFIELGIQKIKNSIDLGFPVLVSVKPGFGENGGDHLILIVGYGDDSFFANDPQRKGHEKDPMRVSVEKFKEFWKGLTIFVES